MTLGDRLGRVRNFVLRAIGTLPGDDGQVKSLPARIIRVGHLLIRGYVDDDLAIHASSLTFVTFLASKWSYASGINHSSSRVPTYAPAHSAIAGVNTELTEPRVAWGCRRLATSSDAPLAVTASARLYSQNQRKTLSVTLANLLGCICSFLQRGDTCTKVA